MLLLQCKTRKSFSACVTTIAIKSVVNIYLKSFSACVTTIAIKSVVNIYLLRVIITTDLQLSYL